MNYILFWNVKLDGVADIACGSDSQFRLDGRWNKRTAIAKASAHAAMLNRNLKKGYVGLSFGERGPMIALSNGVQS